MSPRRLLIPILLILALAGCARGHGLGHADAGGAEPVADARHSAHAIPGGWGPSTVVAAEPVRHVVTEAAGPYLLDTGDRLRIFVYGQPNLSRLYIVDETGAVSFPLIGRVNARGLTTSALERAIRAKLGTEFVKDPQVTVDVQQNRPFFILGEVRAPGQYPYVNGMTVETAVAIAGGFSERASERKFRITRRQAGLVEHIEAPGDFVLKPSDTVYVFERYF